MEPPQIVARFFLDQGFDRVTDKDIGKHQAEQNGANKAVSIGFHENGVDLQKLNNSENAADKADGKKNRSNFADLFVLCEKNSALIGIWRFRVNRQCLFAKMMDLEQVRQHKKHEKKPL